MTPSDSSSDTTQDLLSPFASLSLSDFLSATVSLVSADGHTFPVNLCKLVGSSSVLAEMLKKDEGGGKTLKLSEGREEVEAFVKAVEEGTCQVDLETSEWDSLCDMAQKYDSEPVRGVLSKTACSAFSKEPLLACIAAFWLGNEGLAKICLLPALSATIDEAKFSEEGEEGTEDEEASFKPRPNEELAIARVKGMLACCVCQSDVVLELQLPTCDRKHDASTADALEKLWLRAVHSAMKPKNLGPSPALTLRKELDARDYGGIECAGCLKALQKKLLELDEEWENGEDGKKAVLEVL
ncbi:hypothetical protein JCM6882_004097 [Rhodosporidiobolus microsporus]